MIAAEGIDFGYGEHPVLRGASLTAGAGELVCLIGPNGAGKSTLLKILAGLLEPTAGGVHIHGRDPRQTPRGELARVLSYLPQDYRLAFPFTVRDVVMMGRYPHRRRGILDLEGEDDARAADEAMRTCEVLELAHRRFDTLSGGERRRALLAQAFCQRAELLLLDEPTAALDPAHAISLLRALAHACANGGHCALVVTHDVNLAARYADRLMLLDGGRITADGPPADVLASEATERAFQIAMHVGRLPGSGGVFAVPATEPPRASGASPIR
jgi:iron complex transport system ATP-binding protein